MSQGVYDAATLERWNVVNRVLPDDELHEKGMRFAQRLADRADQGACGDQAHRPGLPRGRRRSSRRGDRRAGRGSLFETEDLKNAVRSFLADGPGNATFEGR